MFIRRILALLVTMIVMTLTALTVAGTTAGTPAAMRFAPPCYATGSCPPGTVI